jgi:uncharacterized membrane protein YGL010W
MRWQGEIFHMVQTTWSFDQIYKEELLFFRKYHRQKLNRIIHSVCVPIEEFSFLLLLSLVHLIYLKAVIYFCYHLCLRGFFPKLIGVTHLLLAALAHFVSANSSITFLLFMSFGLQVIAWFCQVVVGHMLIERNQPGFLDKVSFHSVALSLMLAWDYYWTNRKGKMIDSNATAGLFIDLRIEDVTCRYDNCSELSAQPFKPCISC